MAKKPWTFEATKAGYGNMWRSIAIKASDLSGASKYARKIVDNEAKYRAVSAATGVPWYFIGALHMRESGCDFAGVLHNGDRIIGTGRKTYRVPKNRGPFNSWAEAATDALKLKDLHKIKDWSIERMGYHAELFNGVGYIGKGVNSAYLWAGSSHEQRGKYVADHVWDKDFDDPQIGVMTVLKRLCELRPDIDRELNGRFVPPPPDVQPVEKPAPQPAPAPAPKPEKQPWYKRLWAKVAGGIGLGTGVTVGGITLDADTIYAICALVVIGALATWFAVRFIKPRLA